MKPDESRPVQESDTIPLRGVAIAMAVTVAVTLGCFVWVSLVVVRAVPSPAPAPRPPSVDQTLFTMGRGYSSALLDQQRRVLDSYGWVDREGGVIRIPIERAMEIVAAEGGATR